MKKFLRSNFFPPLVVLLAVSVPLFISYSMSRQSTDQERRAAIQDYSKLVVDEINARVNVFEETLRGGVGLFEASDDVTKDDFKKFYESTNTMERYPGAQGIGFSRVVTTERLNIFTEKARQNINPSFQIAPRGQRTVYAPILYLEPENDRNQSAIGYDMFSENIRMNAMESARDTNNVQISSAVRLVQENGEDEQLGFLMYAPLYKRGKPHDNTENRRDNIEGYVYAAFRAHTFFSNILDDRISPNIGVEIVSGDEDKSILYASENFQSLKNTYKNTLTVDVGDQDSDWLVVLAYEPNKLLTTPLSSRPNTILIFGTIGAVLISVVTYLLLAQKSRHLLLVKERDINEAKDSLLSIASHQLRTPATGVKQYLGMVLQGFSGDISENQRNLLEKAYDSNERQLKTINEVLYLARLDSGRIILSKSKISLRSIVESAAEEQNDLISEKGHTLKIIKPKKVTNIDADSHMLRMIVENLLSNAVKYTKPNGKIVVKIKNLKKSMIIEVKDNGIGIAKVDQGLLFKQFSRIPNELTKTVPGTGIGLYLAKHLAELHGGTITVDSDISKGTTFTLTIPK